MRNGTVNFGLCLVRAALFAAALSAASGFAQGYRPFDEASRVNPSRFNPDDDAAAFPRPPEFGREEIRPFRVEPRYQELPPPPAVDCPKCRDWSSRRAAPARPSVVRTPVRIREYEVPSRPQPVRVNRPTSPNPPPQPPTQPPTQSPPAAPPARAPANDVAERITRRYHTPGISDMLALPTQSALANYAEVMQMIDTRHLQPAPVAARVSKGVENLKYALDNPAFQQASGASLTPERADAFRRTLDQALAQGRVQSLNDAMQFAGWAARTGEQQYGLRGPAVVLEFVYGACESLDKYSTFVPPERVAGASLQLEESIVGIGVQLEPHEQGVVIQKVLPDSPALAAGLQAGDVLVSIGGTTVAGLDLNQTADLITGPEGSNVALLIQRGREGMFTLSVPRQQVQLHSVTDVRLLSDNPRIGYFRLEKFANNSTQEVQQALSALHRQGMRALVLDLRGNPGGLLTGAVEIADLFLPDGTIVSTRGRNPGDNMQETAHREQTWKVPLVLVVDHGSASASEILAAAIQENGRGVIVGRPSYGKGTVQTQFPLRLPGASVRLTTAKFYSPQGREMAGAGVKPDVLVEEAPLANGRDADIDAAFDAAKNLLQPNI